MSAVRVTPRSAAARSTASSSEGGKRRLVIAVRDHDAHFFRASSGARLVVRLAAIMIGLAEQSGDDECGLLGDVDGVVADPLKRSGRRG